MNELLQNSSEYFRYVASNLSEEVDDFTVIQLTLFWVLGLEKLFKGILYDLNPIFILSNPEFNNAIQIEYKKNLVENRPKDKCTINADVITYRNTVFRMQNFSKAVNEYKGVLLFLGDCRDVIVHHKHSLLDLSRLKTTLLRDYAILMYKLETETNGKHRDYFIAELPRLQEIAKKYQDDVKGKLELKYLKASERWKSAKTSAEYLIKSEERNQKVFALENRHSFPCPVCGNKAAIYTKTIGNINIAEGKTENIGLNITALRCVFCRLDLSHFEEFDHLKLYEHIYKQEEEESA